MAVELEKIGREAPPGPPFKMSRRQFLWAGIALAYLAAATSIPVILNTSQKDSWDNPWKKGFVIYPGWIEDNVTAPLIQAQKGHFYWVRQAVFTNQIVKELTEISFKYLIENRDRHNRLAPGGVLSHTIATAGQKLDQIDAHQIHPDTNKDLEAIHLGSVVLAATFNPWYQPAEMEALGASISGFTSVTDYIWNPKKGLTITLPRLFGLEEDKINKHLIKPDEEQRLTGEDRSIHFAQHFLLAFEYLSSTFNLPDHKNIPLGSR